LLAGWLARLVSRCLAVKFVGAHDA
jgi:hypothetical protein